MNSKVEFKKHNTNLLSIRDLEDDIDIASDKWDALFSECVTFSKVIYFKGERAYSQNSEVNSLLKAYSSLKNNSDISFAKIVKSSLLCRNGFSNIWQHYEYPFLFFFKDDPSEDNFEQNFKFNWTIENVMETLTVDALVIYKSFEQDVIWIMKTSNLSFPSFIQ